MSDPFVVGIPFTEQISLIAIGIPIKGPKSTPFIKSLSIASAQIKAFALLICIYACSLGFNISIRSK